MSKAKLSANNQIMIPEAIRDKLQLTPGDVLDFLENEHGEIILKKANRMEALFSVLDEINEEASNEGIKEQDLLDEWEKVRRERSYGEE
ncbi:AbrB/MazE/SpoVT family DNA-binding domain-containing protein [Shimazuella alba]|jgi:AbrB family looped-hinge helix DNA binding protein|uniref:AbrB family transcriptional regulator n=1 Tax=Shimazuella alba TaxID=2690964 RepID=A0A6I4VSW5_9BACL|nr:AbrB/MazE/SpoVT family DNA-binding domain-containing protein [Shimazuella alba]MXQ54667.1 AbrB family transcriptional regulator [Shimazuella alba]